MPNLLVACVGGSAFLFPPQFNFIFITFGKTFIMFYSDLSKPYRHFLDNILKVLSDNPVYTEETYIYKQTCFEKVYKPFSGRYFPFNEMKKIIPLGYETQFLKTALQYLEANKLITSIQFGEHFSYLISYEGLLISKNGGLIWQNCKLKIKSYLQNGVWLVTLMAFSFTTYSFFCNTYTLSTSFEKISKLENDIDKNYKKSHQKIKMLEKEILQLRAKILKGQQSE